MSCPYYWWNNHYACRKSGKDVNEDAYSRYSAHIPMMIVLFIRETIHRQAAADAI